MFGFIKNLLRRPTPETPAESFGTFEPPPPPVSAPASDKPAFARPPLRRNQASPTHPSPHPSPLGKSIEVSLQKILNALPLELQPRLRQADVGDLTLSVPLEKILAQLSRGSVKISFGELRQALPELFTPENDRDRVLVPLPLEDILARLNPALITRRRVQRQVEVPSDISSPFDPESQSLIYSVGPGKPEAQPPPAPAPARATTPVPAGQIPFAAPSVQVNRQNVTFARKPAAPSAQPPSAPVYQNLAPSLKPVPSNHSPSEPPTPPAVPAFPPTPVPGVADRSLREMDPPQTPAGIPFSIAPKAAPIAARPAPVAPQAAPESDPLIVSLTSLAEGWPEAIRKEIVDLKLVDARVALPSHSLEQGLKQGRLAFSWKTLRSWIRPNALPSVSALDGTVLELPLKIVAPLYLARQREGTQDRQKVAVDEAIPNLFFGFPQPEPAGGPSVAAATARPSDTNYYVWDDSSDMVKVHESETKRGPSPGTKFVAKYATPNEVVSRAAAMDGVAGALIALPDGLMVASRLSPDLNGDTLAAFLPQIFGKVSACTKELRMGDLNNLNFTVGNVPWKIFRVNAIFFAAFGRAGEPLPTGQLAALAAELDHKPK